MSDSQKHTVRARRGAATILKAGQTIKIINTSGTQVVDTWAFAIPSPDPKSTTSKVTAAVFPAATSKSVESYSEQANAAAAGPEYMSMCHTRASLLKMTPRIGDTLRSNKRAPMITLVEDSSPGVHDMLMAACDRWRYSELGVEGYHESCTDNCWDALNALAQASVSLDPDVVSYLKNLQKDLGNRVPDPFNLFMNIPAGEGEGAIRPLSFDWPKTKAGDYVCLKAERDVVVAMSACPQDVLDINGKKPTDAHYQILD